MQCEHRAMKFLRLFYYDIIIWKPLCHFPSDTAGILSNLTFDTQTFVNTIEQIDATFPDFGASFADLGFIEAGQIYSNADPQRAAGMNIFSTKT